MEAKEPYELFDDLGNLVEEKGFETDWNDDVLYVIVPYNNTDGKKASAEIRVCLLNDETGDVCITYQDYLKQAKQSYLEDALYDGVSTLTEFVEYIDDQCDCEEKDLILYDEEDLPVIVKKLSSLVSKMKKDLKEVSTIFSDALKNHSERRMTRLHKRRFESLNNNDKRNAVAKFFGISPSEVSINTVSGYDGPVTEAMIDGNTFWILTEDEAYREATESFLNTGLRGSDIERDSYLNMAARNCPFDLDRVAEYYCDYMEDVDENGDERSYDEIREDEYELEQWADSRFSIEDLWDNDLIDKVQFCHNIWDMDGVGMELDIEQRTESIDANGETLYIVLRDGEWLDAKEEQSQKSHDKRV